MRSKNGQNFGNMGDGMRKGMRPEQARAVRQQQQQMIDRIREVTGQEPSRFARGAGLSASTLNKFKLGPDDETLTNKTVITLREYVRQFGHDISLDDYSVIPLSGDASGSAPLSKPETYSDSTATIGVTSGRLPVFYAKDSTAPDSLCLDLEIDAVTPPRFDAARPPSVGSRPAYALFVAGGRLGDTLPMLSTAYAVELPAGETLRTGDRCVVTTGGGQRVVGVCAADVTDETGRFVSVADPADRNETRIISGVQGVARIVGLDFA